MAAGQVALQQTVEQTVTGLGYELVEIERSAGGLLRITIDLPWVPGAVIDPFVTVEDCEKVTRQLQFALEVDGVEYRRLEVSSPGKPAVKPGQRVSAKRAPAPLHESRNVDAGG
jgi:ribosome maturation factor RimP